MGPPRVSLELASLRDAASGQTLAGPALFAKIRTWFIGAPPTPDDATHNYFIEVAFSGANDDPVVPPLALDASREWFSLGFARQTSSREAIVLWYAANPVLLALREHPAWDHYGTLGFDFVAMSYTGAAQLWTTALVGEIVDRFSTLRPVAIETRGDT